MSNVDEVIASLKSRAAAAERAKMLAEIQVSQAQEQVAASSQVLREKFGVTNIEEAKSLIASQRELLESKAAELSKLLDEVEESQCPMS